jgi:hypothetical protein
LNRPALSLAEQVTFFPSPVTTSMSITLSLCTPNAEVVPPTPPTIRVPPTDSSR